MIDASLRRRIAALTAVLEQAPLAAVELPLQVQSANVALRGISPGHMHAKRKSGEVRKSAGAVACVRLSAARHFAKHGALVVHMVRLGAGALDDDNLAGAFKALRDGFATKLKVDDRDPRLQFVTSQHVTSHLGVIVEIYRPADLPPLRRGR